MLLSPRQQLLAPGLDVVLVAALQQHQELHAAEAPDDLFRMQRFFQQLGEFDQYFLAANGADVTLDRAELVELDHGEAAHAAGVRARPGAA